MKKFIIGFVVLFVLLAGTLQAYLYYFDFEIKPAPAQVLSTEQALAAPGLLALASADVAHMADLHRKFGGSDEDTLPTNASEDDSSLAILLRAGLKPRESITHALGAVIVNNDGSIGTAMVMHGNFDVASLKTFIEKKFVAEEIDMHNIKVLKFYKENLDYCEPQKHWMLSLDVNRIIIIDQAIADTVLPRLAKNAPAARDLAWWRHFRSTRLAGAVAFIPDDNMPLAANPLARGPMEKAKSQLNNFHSVYLGSKVKALPPALNVTLWLGAHDGATADATVQQWMASIAQSKSQWQKLLPTVASLHDAVQVSTVESTVIAEANLGRSWVEKLAEVPGELINSLFGNAGLSAGDQNKVAAGEQLQQNPAVYHANYPIDGLGDYNPEVQEAGLVDTNQGPFGARIERIALGEISDVGLELDVSGLATGIANLGPDQKRVRMTISHVNSHNDENLLIEETCGLTRNTAGSALAAMFPSHSLATIKTLRLEPLTTMPQIKEIVGQFELNLPVSTQTVVVDNPQMGSRLEGGGVRVNVTGLSGNRISYNYSGKIKNLLDVRALNKQGKPLAQTSSFGGRIFLGSGSFKSVEYAGNIAKLEAIFSTKDQTKTYPFTLTGNRPMAMKDQLAGNTRDFSSESMPVIKQKYARAAPALPASSQSARAYNQTGPFTILLLGAQSLQGFQPRLELLSATIPNLEESLSAVHVSITKIRLKSGKMLEAPKTGTDRFRWMTPITFSKASGKAYLFDSFIIDTGLEIKLEDISHILGDVTLFVPTAVDRFYIDKMEVGTTAGTRGVDVTVHALHRGKVELRSKTPSERLLRVKAYNAERKELWLTFPEVKQTEKGWQGLFPIHGAPDQLEVNIPYTLNRTNFPFRLRLE